MNVVRYSICSLVAVPFLAFGQGAGSKVEPGKCSISLPYRRDAALNCSPKPAAAYDFAFCAVNYRMASRAALEMNQPTRSGQYEKAEVAYARISEALSDKPTHQRNTELAQDYFTSLIGQPSELVRVARSHVDSKCEGVEDWHSKILVELIARLKDESERKRQERK
jgi:hypothetical protein